jgi:FkbM family methyltransferase
MWMNPPNAAQAAARRTEPAPALQLKLRDGVTVAVPPTLASITTYVLLEQEAWFEKEIDLLRVFLQPGMTAVDIGANLGVYSLPMARLVGPGGRVFAYEPGGEARALLEQSRDANGFGNLDVLGLALSDGEREGYLGFADSSELRALGAGSGESVRITSLDVEGAVRGWQSVDFVKIDAEGEEERIIAGGKEFFVRHSPLVMIEIKAGNAVNERLRQIYPAIGYKLYRQLAGAPLLVPVDPIKPLDGYELNLFAAKPDRAQSLAQRELLVESIADWRPEPPDLERAIAFWRRQPFASLVTLPEGGGLSADQEYQNALVGYAVWRATEKPVAERCAALAFALQSARIACARGATATRASTWARLAWEWGARSESITALQRLLQLVQGLRLQEPFWPAAARFDDIAAGDRPLDWFVAAGVEQHERTFSFSSAFGGATALLDWLCQQPFASAEMERRRVLTAAAAGARPRVPQRLCAPAPDHLNAEIWRAGLVPGTAP